MAVSPDNSPDDPPSDSAGSDPNALKKMFNEERFRQVASEISTIYAGFDAARFLTLSLPGLEPLTLMQRLRRMTESLRATLPDDYRGALAILEQLAPRINHGFVAIVLPDYVALYGHHDFERSMLALKYFTKFGSSEFAIREFLRRDLQRTLAVMQEWSLDKNEHVRRLASEGSRPRLPWSFRLDELIRDPSPTAPILENLKADPSLYVRKSVANHLNDIAKDHPDWVMDRLETWPRDHAHTAWIAKRALRTLIKQGNPRALSLIGAGEAAQIEIANFSVHPRDIALGDKLTIAITLQSTTTKSQRLVVDYTVHYVKKNGGSSAKVFKLKEFTLEGNATATLTRSQSIRNFTTRVHYPGRHDVEVVVNGQTLARDYFVLEF